MLSSGRSANLHYDTCLQCGGERTGSAWRSRQGRNIPVCKNCTTLATVGPPPCPRRCGPGGDVGPACRFRLGHLGDCLPRGGMPRLLVLAAQLRPAEAAA